MRGERDTEQIRRGPGLMISMTERALRKHQALAADDHIIEWKQGKVQHWSVAAIPQPLPPAFAKLDIPRLRGLSGCSYSARRLFLGSAARVVVDLEAVWHAHATGKLLDLMFSNPDLTAVRWQSDEAEDTAVLAGFAERIMAQRERRLAELPRESAERATAQLADLTNAGSLAAALAGLGPPTAFAAVRSAGKSPNWTKDHSRVIGRRKVKPTRQPQTVVGQWLLATTLVQRELRDQLVESLNGGQAGWNDDEPAVVEATAQIASRKLFPTGADTQQVAALVARMRELIAARNPELKPTVQEVTEAVIHRGLGNPEVDLSQFRKLDVLHAHGAVIAAACSKLALADDAVTQMIVDGEQLAFKRGWHPPLAAGPTIADRL
jgi:hypothetical protein